MVWWNYLANDWEFNSAIGVSPPVDQTGEKISQNATKNCRGRGKKRKERREKGRQGRKERKKMERERKEKGRRKEEE